MILFDLMYFYKRDARFEFNHSHCIPALKVAFQNNDQEVVRLKEDVSDVTSKRINEFVASLEKKMHLKT